jgi:hypothetical protein
VERAKFGREHPPDKETLAIFDAHEIDLMQPLRATRARHHPQFSHCSDGLTRQVSNISGEITTWRHIKSKSIAKRLQILRSTFAPLHELPNIMSRLLQFRWKSILGGSRFQSLDEIASAQRRATFFEQIPRARKWAHMRTRSDKGSLLIC